VGDSLLRLSAGAKMKQQLDSSTQLNLQIKSGNPNCLYHCCNTSGAAQLPLSLSIQLFLDIKSKFAEHFSFLCPSYPFIAIFTSFTCCISNISGWRVKVAEVVHFSDGAPPVASFHDVCNFCRPVEILADFTFSAITIFSLSPSNSCPNYC